MSGKGRGPAERAGPGWTGRKNKREKKTAKMDMQVSVKTLFYLTFYAFSNIVQLSSPQMWLLQLPT